MENNLLILISLTLAAISDFKYFKIFNWITYPLIITGIIYTIFNPISALDVLLKVTFCIILLFVPFFGQGGDRKLLMGLTLMLGAFNSCLIFIGAATLSGVGIMLRNKYYLKQFLPYGLERGYETNIGVFFVFAYIFLVQQEVIIC